MLLNVIAANLVILAVLGAAALFGALAFANQWGWRFVGFGGLLGLLNLMAFLQSDNHAAMRAILNTMTGWVR